MYQFLTGGMINEGAMMPLPVPEGRGSRRKRLRRRLGFSSLGFSAFPAFQSGRSARTTSAGARTRWHSRNSRSMRSPWPAGASSPSKPSPSSRIVTNRSSPGSGVLAKARIPGT